MEKQINNMSIKALQKRIDAIEQKKGVINTKTGEIYGTVNEAADFLGMKRTTLISQLKGINKNKTNFKYYV